MDIHLHSLIRPHGAVLNELSTEITLPLPYMLVNLGLSQTYGTPTEDV
jgi:hypothetical protein